MAVSHSYFRADGLNGTGYIDDYTYAKAAKQSSKVGRSYRAEYHAMHRCDLRLFRPSNAISELLAFTSCGQAAFTI